VKPGRTRALWEPVAVIQVPMTEVGCWETCFPCYWNWLCCPQQGAQSYYCAACSGSVSPTSAPGESHRCSPAMCTRHTITVPVSISALLSGWWSGNIWPSYWQNAYCLKWISLFLLVTPSQLLNDNTLTWPMFTEANAQSAFSFPFGKRRLKFEEKTYTFFWSVLFY
jgi:hypothetical protein